MKRGFFLAIALLTVVSLFFSTCCTYSFAAKKSKPSSQTLKVVNNKGETILYGSVLSPKEDEANILLSKTLLSKIRKIGAENLSVNLTSSLDSTKTYSVPNDALSIQRKVINKKPGKYLVISLFNLSTLSGITISPSSLPSDDYKLRLTGKDLDATTEKFNYQTPALFVGTVDSETTGLVTIESLAGDPLSERTVATNPNGTFFTEVRASKITPETRARKLRKVLRAQVDEATNNEETTEKEVVEEIHTCVIDVEAEKNYKTIAPLNSNNNTDISDKPIKVDDASTFNANIAIESAREGDDELALESAKAIVEDLKSDEDDEDDDFENFQGDEEDFTCDIGDIGQFSDRCSDDPQTLSSIGRDFREFVLTANCNFPEFKLIKAILPKLPEDANEFVGRGYCEISQEEDNNRPCDIYRDHILPDFKKGLISQLPCPPDFCKEFSNIKPPKCFAPHRICEEPFNDHIGPGPQPFQLSQVCRGPRCPGPHIDDGCIHRPMKDLYCSRIGIDIKEVECSSQGFSGPYSPSWVVEGDDEGNLYCVPSNIPQPQFPIGYQGPRPPSTPKEMARECKVNSCHKVCSEKYGFREPYPLPPPPPVPPPPLTPPPLSLSPPSGVILKAQFIPPPYTGSKGDYIEPSYNNSSGPQYQTSPIHPEFSPPPLPTGPNFGPPGHFECKECDCHRECDAEAGRLIECNDRDKYFSKKCCDKGPGPIIFFQTLQAQSFSGGGFGPGRGPIGNNVYDCLCKDTVNNFNEKGYVKPEAQKACQESCPQGYEKDANYGSDQCLPICDKERGFVRDPGGICRKKCPEGSFDDGTGYCRCPEGQFIGKSGKCESSPTCPQYCYNYPLFRELLASHDFTGTGYIPPSTGPGYVPPGSTGSYNALPPECQRCTGGGGQITCPPGQIVIEENVVCVQAPCPPIKRCVCPDRTQPINGQCGGNTCPEYCKNYNLPTFTATLPPECQRCNNGGPSTCSGNMLPNPNSNGEAQCICPPSLPYWNNNQCVASCPNGPPSPSASYNSPPKSPIPCSGGNQCPPATPIKCSDGRCAVSQAECGQTSNYCSPGILVGTNGCICNPSGGSYQVANYCQCPSGSNSQYASSSYTKEYGCTTSGTTQCPPPYIKDPAFPNSCKCPDGTPYEVGSTCAAQCPTGLTPSTSPGGPYSSTRQVCKCSDGTYPTGNGICTSSACPPASPYRCPDGTCRVTQSECSSSTGYCPSGTPVSNGCSCNPSGGTTTVNGYCTCPSGSNIAYTPASGCASTSTSNYCSPGIAVGTSSCTCNPGGGAYNSAGYCTCPSGSTSPYTKETGCTGSTSSRPCTAGEGPSANNCYCFGAGYVGTDGKCQCSGGVQYTGGGCGTSTSSHVCALGEAATTTNPCYCANGATFTGPSSTGTCQCTNGQVYASGGCPGSTTRTCTRYEVSSSSNPCTCASGATLGTDNICKCPSGQVYKDTGCTTATITLSDAALVDNNLRVNLNVTGTEGTGACYYLYKGSGTTSIYSICATGQSDIPLSTLTSNNNPVVIGDQLKFCLSIDSTICSTPFTTRDGCTGGKTFNSSSNTCQCPASQTTDANGQCVASTTSPSAPSNLQVTSTTATQVALSWTDNSTNEDGFKIYRKPANDANATWTHIGTAAVSITTYTDTTVASGTSYNYHINSYNANGNSTDSNTVTATTP